MSHRITSHLMWIAVGFMCGASLACNMMPTYNRPSAPTTPWYKEFGGPNVVDEWKVAEPGDFVSRGRWWEMFNDPQLDSLEERINISNQNIAAAAASVQVARALVREARARFYPTVTTNPSVVGQHIPAAFGRPLGTTFIEYAWPIEASWEPDLWGKVRSTVLAASYAAESVFANLENVRLTAQADLATNYYSLRSQDYLKGVLDSTTAAYKETYDLTRASYVAGRENYASVVQAEAQYKAAEALAYNTGILRAQYEHAIAVLIGEPPAMLSIPVNLKQRGPPVIPVGVPSQLLERRPDIAAAERAVARANAQIGVAKAAFYPNLTISGSFGVLANDIKRLFSWPSRAWSIGVYGVDTLYDGGLHKATLDQFRAAYDQTVANYRQTVLTAFQQVEDNLASLRILARVIEQQVEAVEAAREGYELASDRYLTGLDPYTAVLTAQIVYLNQQQTWVNYRLQQMVGSVALVKALGGGWDLEMFSQIGK